MLYPWINTMVYITRYTIGIPYEDEGLHSALNLEPTVPKWTQGKKPDRKFILFLFLTAWKKAHAYHPRILTA